MKIASTVVFLLLAVFVAGYAAAADRQQDGIKLHHGYRYEVVAEHLRKIDNLSRTASGNLYATLEIGRGKGALVEIDRNGKFRVLMQGLNKPDGLKRKDGKLYLVEEVSRGRVLEYDIEKGEHRTITRLQRPEGLIVLPNGDLLVTEDKDDGRLVRVDMSGKITVMITGLQRSEGLALGQNGTVYIAETGSGRILTLDNNKLNILIEGLKEPDQVVLDSNGGLWISEDQQPGRLLCYRDKRLETIASGLQAPQGVLVEDDGILVAEQERHRVIRIYRATD